MRTASRVGRRPTFCFAIGRLPFVADRSDSRGEVWLLATRTASRQTDRALARGDGLSPCAGGRSPAVAGRRLQVMAERARRAADDASMTAPRSAARSRPCSMSPIRSPAPICSRSARRASIGRWSRPEDYDRFAGFEARIELGRPLDGPQALPRPAARASAERPCRLATDDGRGRIAARRRSRAPSSSSPTI